MQTLSVAFQTRDELYRSYLSFLSPGGIFIKTTLPFSMGERVKVEISLPDAEQPHEVVGDVVWINPSGAQSQRPQGIGVLLNKDDADFNHKIICMLGDLLEQQGPTYTL